MIEFRNIRAGYGNGKRIVGKNWPSGKQLQKSLTPLKKWDKIGPNAKDYGTTFCFLICLIIQW